MILGILSLGLAGCGSGSGDADPVASGPAATGSTTPPEAKAAETTDHTSDAEAQQRAANASRR